MAQVSDVANWPLVTISCTEISFILFSNISYIVVYTVKWKNFRPHITAASRTKTNEPSVCES